MRIYRPTTAAKELLPIGLFAHGGGYVCGSLDSEDFLCRALVERVRSVVVSVEYRLAPECKAPAQMEDAVRGFEWVSSFTDSNSNAMRRGLRYVRRHTPTPLNSTAMQRKCTPSADPQAAV
jgi:acetyl esterase/lipase